MLGSSGYKMTEFPMNAMMYSHWPLASGQFLSLPNGSPLKERRVRISIQKHLETGFSTKGPPMSSHSIPETPIPIEIDAVCTHGP